jgi:hypothetical protein
VALTARKGPPHLTVVEEGEPEEVIVYCAGCVKRELEGEWGSPGLTDNRPSE